MSSPPDAHGERQRDAVTSVAAWGSAALAVPGLVAAAALVLLGVIAGGEPLVAGGVLVSLVFVGCGFALLRGYWRIRSGRMPLSRQARFWRLSAAYNGAIALAAGWFLLDLVELDLAQGVVGYAPHMLGATEVVVSSALLLWTVWMTVSSLRQASAAASLPAAP